MFSDRGIIFCSLFIPSLKIPEQAYQPIKFQPKGPALSFLENPRLLFWYFFPLSNGEYPRVGKTKRCAYKHNGNMGYGIFKRGGTKLEKNLPESQHTQRNLLNFEFWINGELSKSAKI